MESISILIVDPSAALQKYVRNFFTERGYKTDGIRAANDPQSALKIADEMRPNYLLTDWFAKEAVTGIVLYQRIRTLNPACRFAMFSDDVSPVRLQEAKGAGALFLQAKPCTASELNAALTRASQQITADQVRASLGAVAAQLPKLKVGDRVLHAGSVTTVKHVIFRNDELLVQLEGASGFVRASILKLA